MQIRPMRDETYIRLIKLLPKSALSSLIGTLTRSPAPAALHRLAIRGFARRYGVRLDEAELELHQSPTFAEFFARRLKPGLRPVEGGERVVVAPVDGTVSQIGYVERGTCLQAKGISYTLEPLLQDKAAATQFEGGGFATLYLSPRHYHRTHAGRCAVVQVGATCVARIRASYDGVVTHSRQPARTHRFPTPIPISKGDELGVFEMGSTVILLFEKGRVRWDQSLVPGDSVQMGRRIGEAS